MTRNVHLPLILALAALGVGLWSPNATAQIACTNQDTIGCDIDPETGRWIVRGSAPRKQDKAKPREENAPCWNGLNIPASQCPARPAPTRVEEVVSCWNGQTIAKSRCPPISRAAAWETSHRATLDAWKKRKGLPYEHVALLDELIADYVDGMRMADNDLVMLRNATELGYEAAIGYWQLGQEAFANRRMDEWTRRADQAAELLLDIGRYPSTDHGLAAQGALYDWFNNAADVKPGFDMPAKARSAVQANQDLYRRSWATRSRVSLGTLSRDIEAQVQAQLLKVSATKRMELAAAAYSRASDLNSKQGIAAAIPAYREAANLDPSNPTFRHLLALMLFNAKQYGESIPEFHAFRVLSTYDAESLADLALAQACAGRITDAFATIDRGNLPPDDAAARLMDMAGRIEREGFGEGAIAAADRAVASASAPGASAVRQTRDQLVARIRSSAH